MHVLSPSDRVPSVARFNEALASRKLAGTLRVNESGTDCDWKQIILSHEGGLAIANIQRYDASANGFVSQMIGYFLEQIADCQPSTAAAWLAEYLPTIKTIYSLQVLSGTDAKNGWEILGTVKESIHTQVGGILEAEREGFSNEQGFHILWQFSNSVKGPWWMGVLQDGNWIHFQMDLGNKKQREAFFRGEVPEGVQIAK